MVNFSLVKQKPYISNSQRLWGHLSALISLLQKVLHPHHLVPYCFLFDGYPLMPSWKPQCFCLTNTYEYGLFSYSSCDTTYYSLKYTHCSDCCPFRTAFHLHGGSLKLSDCSWSPLLLLPVSPNCWILLSNPLLEESWFCQNSSICLLLQVVPGPHGLVFNQILEVCFFL